MNCSPTYQTNNLFFRRTHSLRLTLKGKNCNIPFHCDFNLQPHIGHNMILISTCPRGKLANAMPCEIKYFIYRLKNTHLALFGTALNLYLQETINCSWWVTESLKTWILHRTGRSREAVPRELAQPGNGSPVVLHSAPLQPSTYPN